MEKKLRNNMIFHGAIVVLLGLLAGIPFGLVLLESMEGEVRAWRMAHLEGLINGLLVIAVAASVRRLELPDRGKSILAWSLIAMAYGNVVASTLGALFGVRGLAPGGPVVNTVVYVIFMLAVVGVFVGMALVAWGARAAMADTTVTHVRVDVSDGPAGASETTDRASRRRRSHRRDS